MADNKLELIITAKNEATKALKSVDNTLKELNKTVLKVATVGLAGLAAAFATTIPLAFDQELALTNLEQTILSTGGAAGITTEAAVQMAQAFSKATRFSDEQIISAEGLLLTFTKIGKDVFPDAIETTLNMAEKFGGLEASSIQLGKALNDPIAGVGALREVGVSFTEEQAEMIKKMVESGDIASAQRVILDELAVEVGGLAQAYGNTNQGKLVRFKNRMVDLGQYIGGFLIGYVGKFADSMTYLIDAFMEAGIWSSEFWESMEWVTGSQFMSDRLWDIVTGMRGIINILQEMGFAGVTTLQFWVSLNQVFGSSLGNSIREITVTLYEFWLTFRSFVDLTLIPFIKDHSDLLINAFKRLAAILAGGAIISAIATIAGALLTLLNPITLIIAAVVALSIAYDTNFMGLKTTVDTFVKWFTSKAMPAIIKFIENDFIPNFKLFIEVLKTLWEIVKPELEKLREWFINVALPEIIDFIENDFIPALQRTIEWLIKVWNDVKPYLQELALWFLDNALPAIKDYLVNTIIPTIENLITTLGNVWDLVQPKLQALFNWIVNIGFPAIYSFFNNTVIPVINSVTSAFSNIWYTAQPLLQGFVNWMGSTFASIKYNVIDPLINSIQGIISAVQNALNMVNQLSTISIPNPLSLFGYASGGAAKGLFSTGEEGRELVYAPQGAMVFPNDMTERLINQYNLTINTSGSSTNLENDFATMQALAGV